MNAHAGWDEAVQFAQKRHHRANAPKRGHDHRKPIFGLPGQFAPEPRGE